MFVRLGGRQGNEPLCVGKWLLTTAVYERSPRHETVVGIIFPSRSFLCSLLAVVASRLRDRRDRSGSVLKPFFEEKLGVEPFAPYSVQTDSGTSASLCENPGFDVSRAAARGIGTQRTSQW